MRPARGRTLLRGGGRSSPLWMDIIKRFWQEQANRFREDFLFGASVGQLSADFLADFRFLTLWLRNWMFWGMCGCVRFSKMDIFKSFHFAQASCLLCFWLIRILFQAYGVWETASWLTQPQTELVLVQFTQHWIDWKIRKKINFHIAISRRESLKHSGLWVPASSLGQLYITFGIVSNSSSILFGCMHSHRCKILYVKSSVVCKVPLSARYV